MEQVWYLSWSQKVVDEHQELLVRDQGVGQEENRAKIF